MSTRHRTNLNLDAAFEAFIFDHSARTERKDYGPCAESIKPYGAQLLHGVEGLVTEIGELSDGLLPTLLGIDKATPMPINLVEELGDILWYSALLVRMVRISTPLRRSGRNQPRFVRRLQLLSALGDPS